MCLRQRQRWTMAGRLSNKKRRWLSTGRGGLPSRDILGVLADRGEHCGARASVQRGLVSKVSTSVRALGLSVTLVSGLMVVLQRRWALAWRRSSKMGDHCRVSPRCSPKSPVGVLKSMLGTGTCPTLELCPCASSGSMFQ